MEGSSNNDSNNRINQVEKELAVLEHRVNELEDTPPRVNLLENSVNQLEVQFKHMNDDLGEIKTEGKANHKLLVDLGEQVRKLFFIGTVVAAIASTLLVGLKIYDSWTSINRDINKSNAVQGMQHEPKQ